MNSINEIEIPLMNGEEPSSDRKTQPVKKHRSNKINLCKQCNVRFPGQVFLAKHMFDHHHAIDWICCDMCDFKFKFQASLIKHKKKLHGNTLQTTHRKLYQRYIRSQKVKEKLTMNNSPYCEANHIPSEVERSGSSIVNNDNMAINVEMNGTSSSKTYHVPSERKQKGKSN